MLKVNSAADRGDLFQLRSILREWLAGQSGEGRT
jgi:hypothetical protein